MSHQKHTCRLNELLIGTCARIERIDHRDQALCRRLLSLGLVAGTEIQVKGVAPLGDPIQIEALGCKLSLRKSEASHVQVIAAASETRMVATSGSH